MLLFGLRSEWLSRARVGVTYAAFALIGAVVIGAV
jgi:hypothetical protein